AEDGIRDFHVTGVQTCALPILDGFAARHPDRLQIIRAADTGQADALNTGFARADGDLLGWLNADDRLAEGALARLRQTALMEPRSEERRVGKECRSRGTAER